jgi:hypothetical protein
MKRTEPKFIELNETQLQEIFQVIEAHLPANIYVLVKRTPTGTLRRSRSGTPRARRAMYAPSAARARSTTWGALA